MATDADDAALESMLKDAMISTEREIFGDAFGKDEVTLDETGDRSLEAMGTGLEGQHEPDDEEVEDASEVEEDPASKPKPGDDEAKAKEATKVAAEAEAARQDDGKGRVPSGLLREQKELVRAAQAERDALKAQSDAREAASQKAIGELNAKHEALMALIQRQQPSAPAKPAEAEKPKIPDILEDPTAYAEYVTKQIEDKVEARVAALQTEVKNQHLNQSMNSARSRHGEAFDAAYKALTSLNPQNPQHAQLVQGILAQPDPGEAAVTWYKRNEAMREIGEDPAAYKARVAEETRNALLADPKFREQMLKSIRAEAPGGDNGAPRNIFKIPGSLGQAQGGNGRGSPNDLDAFDGSEQAIFNGAFAQT